MPLGLGFHLSYPRLLCMYHNDSCVQVVCGNSIIVQSKLKSEQLADFSPDIKERFFKLKCAHDCFLSSKRLQLQQQQGIAD